MEQNLEKASNWCDWKEAD